MIFPDTDVMVDVLRKHPSALAWLREAADEPILLCGFVLAELLQGCRTKAEQKKVRDALAEFAVAWPTQETCNRALELFGDFHLSHGLGLIDALVGQTAVDLGVELLTFNARHYACIPGIRSRAPYDRAAAGPQRHTSAE
jgi:predicted nucleic acid-binding protein